MAEVAEAAGISRQHLWRIETAKVLNPSPAILARIAAYAMSLADLLSPSHVDQEEASAGAGDEKVKVIGRLLRHAYDLPDEDWQRLEEIANRASARLSQLRGD